MKKSGKSSLPVATKAELVRQRLKQERITLYRTHRNLVGEEILRAALRAHASLESGDMVNVLLDRRLNLAGVSIDMRELQTRVATVLRAEVSAALFKHSILPDNIKERAIRRLVAQLLPTRDDVVVPNAPSRIEKVRVEDLVKAIQRETRQIVERKK